MYFPLIFKGVLLGLTLSFMIGPLFFAVVQATLERGFRGGLSVAAGIWGSDLLFVVLVQQGLIAIEAVTALPTFRFWLGLAGGLLLLIFGLVSWIPKPAPTPVGAPAAFSKFERRGIAGYFLKGFLINAINPGTIIFWLGVASGIVAPNRWSPSQTWIFFGSMLLVLAGTDLIKIYAAKKLSQWLTPNHIRMVHKGIGALLFVFGLFMMLQSYFRNY